MASALIRNIFSRYGRDIIASSSTGALFSQAKQPMFSSFRGNTDPMVDLNSILAKNKWINHLMFSHDKCFSIPRRNVFISHDVVAISDAGYIPDQCCSTHGYVVIVDGKLTYMGGDKTGGYTDRGFCGSNSAETEGVIRVIHELLTHIPNTKKIVIICDNKNTVDHGNGVIFSKDITSEGRGLVLIRLLKQNNHISLVYMGREFTKLGHEVAKAAWRSPVSIDDFNADKEIWDDKVKELKNLLKNDDW